MLAVRAIPPLILFGLLALPTASAQNLSDAEGGPQGPRTGTTADMQAKDEEILRLRKRVDELTRKLEEMGGSAAAEKTGDGTFVGTWSGALSCNNRQFALVLTLQQQSGRIAKGTLTWTGANSGTDAATLSPMPSEDDKGAYMLVTAKADTYDYKVSIAGSEMTGMSTRHRCKLFMQRT